MATRKRVAPANPRPKKRPPKNPVDVAMGKECGGFKPGHQLWQFRENFPGPPKVFDTPEDLWKVAVKYFEWATGNPLKESKVVQRAGEPELMEVPKMRAMSVKSFCVFAGFTSFSWYKWRAEREDLQEVISLVEDIIFSQKFEGAAAGLLNSIIIARELGLREQTSSELTGKDGGPLQTEDVTERDAADFTSELSRLLAARSAGAATSEADQGSEGGA